MSPLSFYHRLTLASATQMTGGRLSGLLLLSACLGLTACQPNEPSNAPNTDTQEQHEHSEHDDHQTDHAEHGHDEHDEQAHDEHDEHDHEAAAHHHDHADQPRITFKCQPEGDISVYYHNDDEPKTAHLLLDGLEYDLVEDSNLPAQTYISSLGLDDSHGLVWQVQDKQASLFSVPTALAKAKSINDQAHLEQQNKLYNCQQTGQM
ncbi:hypothetical protein MN210_13160 [Psychrobacter raelei]|uniref:Uncharacterized protein n=1 Tax=Psychrobacter raelei TaxID=2565531 RepID=A0AAT9PES1_9GAMM|nr:hypothetical protein [Psychrobacter sp. PraFG1]UNK04996.1 hypothetical protein MN210_13160 [Psychrobacter sp. PraFG1]